MPCRRVAIVLLLAVLLQALANGAGGVRVLCLGGGHEHTPMQADHCDRSCAHGGEGMLPRPADRSEHDCGCTDVELVVVELLRPPACRPSRCGVRSCMRAGRGIRFRCRPPRRTTIRRRIRRTARMARCAHRRATVSCVRLNV